MIDEFKISGEWKTQLTMNFNFILSKDDDKQCIQKVINQVIDKLLLMICLLKLKKENCK